MVSKEIGPGGVEIWRAKAGELRQWSPAPGVLCSCYEGHITEDLAPAAIDFYKQINAQAPRLVVFTDADKLTNYDTNFRLRLVMTLQKLGDRIEIVHVFTRSKLALAALSAANLVLRNVGAHYSRASFDATLVKVVAERTGAPPPA